MKKKKVRCLLNGKREDPIKNKELKEIERPTKKKRDFNGKNRVEMV